MTNFNRIMITWICYLSYAFVGALIIVNGIIMESISKYFKLPILKISTSFTFLNLGILISIFLNFWLIKIISFKKQFVVNFFSILLIIIFLINNHNIKLFSFCMFILGIIAGTTISNCTFLIINLYEFKKRGYYLMITDSFFSLSGILFPIISINILKQNICWYWIYFIINIIYLLIVILTINVTFPIIKIDNYNKLKINKIFKIDTLLLSISAMFYIFAQLTFISWVPQYMNKYLNLNIMYSGKLISNFWFYYMCGIWVFSLLSKYITLQKIFIFMTGISTIFMFCFIKSTILLYLNLNIIGLGFFSSGIYMIIITIASLNNKINNFNNINIILTFGTIGTMLTFIISNFIIEKISLYSSLIMSNILYFIVFILSILSYFIKLYKNY
ncbi:MFS transporter TsgA [Candidatus Purcelliella pentastirinorum]|nr:MFS transporter TsgA [Candidatus Purcelliella pentastirinorum]